MTRLLTHHDPFHLHATLGALTLLNYLYRWTLLLTTGTAFPDTEDVRFQTASVLVHTLLPLSSLLLRLPKRRNFSKPMIWPEFRLHSLIFASRHVIATILALYSLTNIYVDAAIVLIAAKLATYVTDTIGDPVQRTTNAMPYPKSFPESYIRNTKLYYAICQFLASALIYGDDPSMCYMPLLAIQISPLMMTLVRKNKASSAAYHVLYSWALFLPALGMLSRAHNFPETASNMIYVVILGDLTRGLRLRLELNKYLIWIVGPIFAMYIQEKLSYYYGDPVTFAYICLGVILPVFAFLRTGHTLFWYQLYKPAVMPVKGVAELIHSMPEYVGEKARTTWEKSKEAHKTLIQ